MKHFLLLLLFFLQGQFVSGAVHQITAGTEDKHYDSELLQQRDTGLLPLIERSGPETLLLYSVLFSQRAAVVMPPAGLPEFSRFTGILGLQVSDIIFPFHDFW